MNSMVKTSIASGFFALAAVVICPSSTPAQTPVPAAHPERAKPAPQPAPQAESDKAKAEEKARQEERIKREREEKAKTGTTPPAKPVPVTGVKAALTEEQRDTMKKAAHFEHVHRVRTARLNRLIRIYKEKGDTAKVQKLEEMKAKEAKRTENAMAGYRKALGEEHWNRLNTEMKRQHARAEKAPSKSGGAR